MRPGIGRLLAEHGLWCQIWPSISVVLSELHLAIATSGRESLTRFAETSHVNTTSANSSIALPSSLLVAA